MNKIFLCITGLVLLSASCGPIQASSAIIRADEALHTAKLMNADKYAPYEYTKADLFFRKAKEKQGFSEFEASLVFAEKSMEYSEKSKQVTVKNAGRLKKKQEESRKKIPDRKDFNEGDNE
jgi:hypothetical protein